MTEPRCKHGWVMPVSQCPDCADIFRMEAKIEAMRELIDGVEDIVAIWGETPYQKTWAREWVLKARKVLG